MTKIDSFFLQDPKLASEILHLNPFYRFFCWSYFGAQLIKSLKSNTLYYGSELFQFIIYGVFRFFIFYFSELRNHNILPLHSVLPYMEERALQINLLQFVQQNLINHPLLERAQLVSLHEFDFSDSAFSTSAFHHQSIIFGFNNFFTTWYTSVFFFLRLTQ